MFLATPLLVTTLLNTYGRSAAARNAISRRRLSAGAELRREQLGAQDAIPWADEIDISHVNDKA